VLVDEINRAMPRTQSVCSSHAEQQVTVDLRRFLFRGLSCSWPQNPIDLKGPSPARAQWTIPLESQDRVPHSRRGGSRAVPFQIATAGPTSERHGTEKILDLQALCRRIFIEGSVRTITLSPSTALPRATRTSSWNKPRAPCLLQYGLRHGGIKAGAMCFG